MANTFVDPRAVVDPEARLGEGVHDGAGPGSALQVGDQSLESRGVLGDRTVLGVDDDGGLGPHRGEVGPELVADVLGDRALGLPPGAGEGAGQRERQRGGGQGQHQPERHDGAATAGREAGEPGEPGIAHLGGGLGRGE